MYRRGEPTASGGLRCTVGYLSSWQVYEGAAVEPYAHSLILGMRAAARDLNCALLLACGVGPPASLHEPAPAWPAPESGPSFVPVGPRNVDGLLVLPTELTPEQTAYLEPLRAAGLPVLMTGPGECSPSVTIDNEGGIRLAVEHLAGHGHTRIGFVAGLTRRRGDSAQRRAAFSAALRALGLPEDPRLVAAGEHSVHGGRRAAEQILASGAPFTALVCSNDRSALGAVSALQAAGRRVPEDVAVTGFDDVPEASAAWPPLTTLRNPSFEKGYQALARLVEWIEGRAPAGGGDIRIATQLVVRRSCGCDPLDGGPPPGQAAALDDLDSALAAVVGREVRGMARGEVDALARELAGGVRRSLREARPGPFQQAARRVLARCEALDEDLFAWMPAVEVLRACAANPGEPAAPPAAPLTAPLANALQREVTERWRLQTARRQLRQQELVDRLNSLSSQLLAALDQGQIKAALDTHLARLGVRRMLLAFARPGAPAAGLPRADGPEYEVLFSFGFARDRAGERFAAWQFSPAAWESAEPPCLSLLPFHVPERLTGFAAFEADNLAPLALLVHNLEAALRTGYLYADALHGRRMAEEANLLKGRFLSMVSHELRTPLNLIAGLSGILLRQKDQPPGPSLWQDLERIYANAQHLGRLIGDVLDLASSTSGHLRLLREPLDLAEVLRPVAAAGEQMARDKGLEWTAELPDSGPYVLGDRTRLRQVALNLVNNAVKFTLRGSVALRVTCDGREVTVAVRDTGLGVAPADQELIWGDFGRAQTVQRRGIGGIGLGLAITRELVERQGGRIALESSGVEGEGSTFSFTLPVIDAPYSRAGRGPADDPRRLAVLAGGPAGSDSAAAGQRLAAGLRARGFTADVYDPADNPRWLARLQADPPGAVLIEELLAARQGWELLAEIKRSPAAAQLPVLVTSAGEHHDGSVLELETETKPLSPDQLTRLLRRGQAAGERLTLLVVDDDPDIRALHCRMIAQQAPGGQILQAADGREALDAMRLVRPDLVLLDLMMPEVDGFDVLEAMHADPRLRDVPVVVLTAKVLTDADMQRLNQGVAAVLTKGVFSADEVVERIESVLHKAHALGAGSQRLVRRALGYIQAHYAGPLTRDQIAAYVNISADHLSDCFHQELGITPIAYLIRYRVYRACLLLEQGGHSITEVAHAVGFSESANFSRAFQREMGMSPRAYLRQRRR